MKNNGAPGNDQIRCYCVKQLTATHNALVTEFKKVYERGEILPPWLEKVYERGKILPPWLVTGRTILLPKNENTKMQKITDR